MKKLFIGGKILNVFTDEFISTNLLVENNQIIGVGNYSDADEIIDVSGKWIVPGFIDGHIHIESTMLTPHELTKVALAHGTVAIVADPHEIANVCGLDGIKYIMEASENLPMTVYIMLPSCVPATHFDESGATLTSDDLLPLYSEDRVLGLAEMMNYPGIIYDDPDTVKKVKTARELGKIINGHAPLLSGADLDKYISAGIYDDHECSSFDEAKERIEKGQWVMIRQGTAARNLEGLLGLFNEPYNRRCLLVTDDKHPADLLTDGHIDNIIRLAISHGQKPEVALRMASFQAAQCFGLKHQGALVPGYKADFVVLDDLQSVQVNSVYVEGDLKVEAGSVLPFKAPAISDTLNAKVRNSFHLKELSKDDFIINPSGKKCRIISVTPGELLTDELIDELDFGSNNGIDISKDIIKLAVIERHHNTGHIGLGYIKGLGIKKGAIAASVSHDSHNLIVAGCAEDDIACAANAVREMGGGCVVVSKGKILSQMPLPIAGLMTDLAAEEIAQQNIQLRNSLKELDSSEELEPFMALSFVSLPVIPALKMSTRGLINVLDFKEFSLFAD